MVNKRHLLVSGFLFWKKETTMVEKTTNILKYKKSKSGQMKIQQTAFMLLAITLLFVLVGMFFIVFKFSGLKQSSSDLQEENALMLVSKIANYPELSCGSSYGSDIGNCIDMDKAIFLLNDRKKYKDLFGVSNVEIRKIYPEGNSVICSLENYPNCDILNYRGQINWI
jgi:hypothetical protein